MHVYITTYKNIYVMLRVSNSCVNFGNNVFLTDNVFAIHLNYQNNI